MSVPAIKAEGLTLMMGGRPLLEGFDLEVPPGQKLLLSGDSGSGKSSFLAALLGFQPLHRGSLEVFGHPVNGDEVWEVRRYTGYLPQEYELKLDTVRDLFYLPFTFKENRHKRPSEDGAREALESLGLKAEMLERDPDGVSGGEKQRVLAASLLQLEKPLYLLDEPSSSLDPSVTETLIEAFLDRPDRTVIAVAHDPEWKERADRVIELPSGTESLYG